MSRVKTFDSTGISPGGVLFAGDLNNLQDHYADLTNLSQTHSVGSLVVGEAGLAISLYASGIMRVSGQLRVDSVVNSITGFQVNGTPLSVTHLSDGTTGTGAVVRANAPTFTGIPVAPTAAPGDNSTKLATTAFVASALTALGGGGGAVPAGALVPYAGSSVPTGWLLCDGSAVSRTTYSGLFAAISTLYGSGDGSTTFNVPDMRGNIPVGKDTATFATLGATGGEETHALTVTELAAHSHTCVGISAGTPTGTVVPASAGTPAGSVHVSIIGSGGLAESHITTSTTGGAAGDANSTNSIAGATFTGSPMGTHGHTFTGNALPSHAHTINPTGNSAGHNNLQPYLVVNYLIKT